MSFPTVGRLTLGAAVCLIGCGGPADRATVGSPPAEPPGAGPPGLVWIPGGEFAMGGDDEYARPDEQPVHPVRVAGFFMGAHTVTNAEFRAFVAATGYRTVAEQPPDREALVRQLPPGAAAPDPAMLVAGSLVFAPTSHPVDLDDVSAWWRWTPGADWRHPTGPSSTIEGQDQLPVVQVAWADAVAYARWIGGRLPTEAEWEYAARGGATRQRYAWGDEPFDPTHPQAHLYVGRFPAVPSSPEPVGRHRPNRFGLFDMAGNVWQWTQDRYDPDSYARDAERGTVVNPTGPTAAFGEAAGAPGARVLRGGSHLCNDSYCRGYRVSARSPGAEDTGTSHTGFRIVMTVDQWRQWHGARGGPS